VGSVTLPASGDVYLDANALIYSVETHPTYWPLLRPVWQAAKAGPLRLVTSELTLLEGLVAPLRRGDAWLVRAYENLFQSAAVLALPITRDVLREAARLRSSTPALRTPDAIHAATILLHSPALFLTNDPGFRRVPTLRVTVLSDLLTP
jgi:predicted nucleic acid-binding protein